MKKQIRMRLLVKFRFRLNAFQFKETAYWQPKVPRPVSSPGSERIHIRSQSYTRIATLTRKRKYRAQTSPEPGTLLVARRNVLASSSSLVSFCL